MISAVIFSAFFSWFILHQLIPHLSAYFLDQINFRSSHHQPTPRGGGIAFVGVTCVASAIALVSANGLTTVFLPLLALPLAVVGLLDDRHNLPALWRYGVQLFISALILGFSPLPQGLIASSVSGIWFLLPSLVFLVISVSAIINFTNFMDGLDGLVAGCMTVASSSLFSINAPWSLWTLVGSLLAFCFLTGVLPKFLWVMLVVLFLELFLLVLYFTLLIGLRPWATFCSPRLCCLMPLSVSSGVCLLDSVSFRLIAFICSNVYIRLAGLIRESLSRTLQLRISGRCHTR